MDPDDSTVPIDDDVLETVEIEGRLYQRSALTYRQYFAPVDDEEIYRLGVAHTAFSLLFDQRLIFPLGLNPRRVLDLGCGAGNWAVDVAEQYPQAEVLGIDISPHMFPDELPSNLELQIDDINKEFTFESNHFDVVHSQMVAGGIRADRWRSYIKDMYWVTRRGGWCQMVEIYFIAQSHNGSLDRDGGLERWSLNFMNSMRPYKDLRASRNFERYMVDAGFRDVDSQMLRLPMCRWPEEGDAPNDIRDRAIGEANAENVQQLLYSLALYPMTQLQGMPMEEFEKLVEEARAEARDPSRKPYFEVRVCIGRKPRRGGR